MQFESLECLIEEVKVRVKVLKYEEFAFHVVRLHVISFPHLLLKLFRSLLVQAKLHPLVLYGEE